MATMTLEELKAHIQKNYNPGANENYYWETGNFDDTFTMGEESGSAWTYLEIGRLLGMDLPDKKESDV